MNRLQWQRLAERWLVDAKCLLDGQCGGACYYVAGYAVECGLKACVLKRVTATPEVVFQDRRFSEKCWTHSLPDLLRQADLEQVLTSDSLANPVLATNRVVVKDWNERARYETMSDQMAAALYAAIADDPNGVMPWIRTRW